MFAILRHRNFGLLWCGQVISVAGDWVLYASLAFYVYTLTGSVLASGAMLILSTLPRIVLGTIAGVFVDRWDRRRTMIVADLGRAAVLLALLAVRSAADLWIVYLVALGDAALGQFFGPAKNALVPAIVDPADLVAANSANSVGEQIGRLAGPALGGFMLARLGLRSVVIADVLSFLVSAGMIALLIVPAAVARARPAPAGPAPGAPGRAPAGAGAAARKVVAELLAGLRLMAASPLVTALFILWTVTSLGEGLLEVLVVPWVSDVLGGTSITFGWMMTAQALGSIAGGALLASAAKTRQARGLVVLGALGWGLIDLAIFNARSIPLTLAFFALVGIPIAAMVVSFNALIQSEVPDAYRGRVFGAFGTAAALTMLAGMMISSALAARVGIVTMLNVACVAVIIGALLPARRLFRASRPPAASPTIQ